MKQAHFTNTILLDNSNITSNVDGLPLLKVSYALKYKHDFIIIYACTPFTSKKLIPVTINW